MAANSVEKTILLLFKVKDDDKAAAKAKSLAKGITATGQAAAKATSQLSNLGGALLKLEAGLGTIAAAFATNAVVEAVKFETAIANLYKIMSPEERENINGFSEDIKNVAATYGETAIAVTEATTEMKLAGFTMKEAAVLQKDALGLSIAGNFDLNTSTQLLIRTLKGFNLEYDKARHIIDGVNEVANNNATTAKKLTEALAITSGTAANAGFSIEELGGVLVPIIEVYGSASDAAVAFKTATLRLTSSQTKIVKQLNALGISQTNANGTLRAGRDIYFEVAEAFRTLDKSQRNQVTATLVGIDQAGRMAQAFGSLDKTIKITNEAINASKGAINPLTGEVRKFGSVQNEVNIKLNTTANVLKRVISAFNILNIEVGDKLRDSVKSGASGVISFAEAFKEVIKEQGAFDSIFKIINDELLKFGIYLKDIALILPEAFAAVDFSKLTAGIQILINTAKTGFSEFTNVDVLTKVIQSVVNGLGTLSLIASGVVEVIRDFVFWILKTADSMSSQDNATNILIGNMLGLSKISENLITPLKAVAGAIVAIGIALTGMSLNMVVGTIPSMVQFGITTKALAASFVALNSSMLLITGVLGGMALATYGAAKGFEWLAEKAGLLDTKWAETAGEAAQLEHRVEFLRKKLNDTTITVDNVEEASSRYRKTLTDLKEATKQTSEEINKAGINMGALEKAISTIPTRTSAMADVMKDVSLGLVSMGDATAETKDRLSGLPELMDLSKFDVLSGLNAYKKGLKELGEVAREPLTNENIEARTLAAANALGITVQSYHEAYGVLTTDVEKLSSEQKILDDSAAKLGISVQQFLFLYNASMDGVNTTVKKTTESVKELNFSTKEQNKLHTIEVEKLKLLEKQKELKIKLDREDQENQKQYEQILDGVNEKLEKNKTAYENIVNVATLRELFTLPEKLKSVAKNASDASNAINSIEGRSFEDLLLNQRALVKKVRDLYLSLGSAKERYENRITAITKKGSEAQAKVQSETEERLKKGNADTAEANLKTLEKYQDNVKNSYDKSVGSFTDSQDKISEAAKDAADERKNIEEQLQKDLENIAGQFKDLRIKRDSERNKIAIETSKKLFDLEQEKVDDTRKANQELISIENAHASQVETLETETATKRLKISAEVNEDISDKLSSRLESERRDYEAHTKNIEKIDEELTSKRISQELAVADFKLQQLEGDEKNAAIRRKIDALSEAFTEATQNNQFDLAKKIATQQEKIARQLTTSDRAKVIENIFNKTNKVLESSYKLDIELDKKSLSSKEITSAEKEKIEQRLADKQIKFNASVNEEQLRQKLAVIDIDTEATANANKNAALRKRILDLSTAFLEATQNKQFDLAANLAKDQESLAKGITAPDRVKLLEAAHERINASLIAQKQEEIELAAIQNKRAVDIEKLKNNVTSITAGELSLALGIDINAAEKLLNEKLSKLEAGSSETLSKINQDRAESVAKVTSDILAINNAFTQNRDTVIKESSQALNSVLKEISAEESALRQSESEGRKKANKDIEDIERELVAKEIQINQEKEEALAAHHEKVESLEKEYYERLNEIEELALQKRTKFEEDRQKALKAILEGSDNQQIRAANKYNLSVDKFRRSAKLLQEKGLSEKLSAREIVRTSTAQAKIFKEEQKQFVGTGFGEKKVDVGGIFKSEVSSGLKDIVPGRVFREPRTAIIPTVVQPARVPTVASVGINAADITLPAVVATREDFGGIARFDPSKLEGVIGGVLQRDGEKSRAIIDGGFIQTNERLGIGDIRDKVASGDFKFSGKGIRGEFKKFGTPVADIFKKSDASDIITKTKPSEIFAPDHDFKETLDGIDKQAGHQKEQLKAMNEMKDEIERARTDPKARNEVRVEVDLTNAPLAVEKIMYEVLETIQFKAFTNEGEFLVATEPVT